MDIQNRPTTYTFLKAVPLGLIKKTYIPLTSFYIYQVALHHFILTGKIWSAGLAVFAANPSQRPSGTSDTEVLFLTSVTSPST